jgi:outer membrane receptor protein involved in Fe transport
LIDFKSNRKQKLIKNERKDWGVFMRFKSKLLLAISVSSTSLISAETASAQDVTPDTAISEVKDSDNVKESTIVVTGSRIKLPNLRSLEPTVSVDSQYLEDRNITNLADALNEIPGFRLSVTPNGAQGGFGQGVNFINSFGLGTQRNLTLLNGRRVVSSNVATVFGNAAPGTQVDLNILPTLLVDRTDRVSVGGAPVYGSDAIAGVTNVILKKNYTGLNVTGTLGITEQGDNFRYNLAGVYGVDFDDGRGNISISASYEKVRGLLFNDRDFYRENIGGGLNPSDATAATFRLPGQNATNDGRLNTSIGYNNGLTDGFPGSVLVRDFTIPSLTRGGLIVNNGALRPLDYNLQFDTSGNLIPFNRGVLYGGAITAPAARAGLGDGFSFNDFSQITSDLKRFSTFAQLNYELFDGINFFAEGLYFNGRGDELVQQPTFNSTLFGGASGSLLFRTDNPFLTDQARGALTAAGYANFRLSRANLDLADPTGFAETDLYRGVVGINGDFKIGSRDFNFEIAANYGRVNSIDFNEGLNQQNFVNAINVTRNGDGQIVCTATPLTNAVTGFTPIADPNCAPLNLFGEGVASQAALDYVIQDVTAQNTIRQGVVNLNVGGSPFDIFNNPVGLNLGYERRVERASFNPDSFQRLGLGRAVAIAPTSGKYTLNEFFGELYVPLISPDNDFVFNRLDLFARGRYVDNSINGGFFSWAAGGIFAPIDDIQFRGNYTKSFRSPSITELFAPITNNFATVADLCSPANIAAGSVPATRTRNCNAFLAVFPTSTPLAAALATVPGRTGGNINLVNEVAKSYSFGVILQPSFIPNFSLSVDYVDIRITKPIANLTAAQINVACFDNENFNAADPANGNAFCSRIRRDTAGQIPADAANPAVTSGFVNGERINFSGIQAVVNYSTKLESIGINGRFEIGGDLFYVRSRLIDTTGVAPARSDGIVGDPEFQGQLRLRYTAEDWGFTTNVNYTGEQLISRFNRGGSPNDTREFDEYNDFVTVDSSIYFKTADDFRMTLSVSNLFNRIGQKYFGYYIPGAINDQFGRSFRLSVSKKY